MAGTSYPIVLTHLDQAQCVVVGGGPVAERKIAALLDSAASVTVISPALTSKLQLWVAAGRLRHIGREYIAGDLDGAALVIAATNNAAVNDEVAQAAQRAGILVNVVDNPAAGTFHTVAIVRQGDVLATVSTGGVSPSLAALLRRRIEALIGSEYVELLEILRAVRADQMPDLPIAVRRQLSQDLSSEQVLEWLRVGQRAQVDEYVIATLDAARASCTDDAYTKEV